MMPDFLRHKAAPWGLVMACVLVTLGACLQALNAPFVSDDSFYITGNAKLAALPVVELWRLFTEPFNPYEFLPLRDLSYWFDLTLFGGSPAAFRLDNFVLYAIGCLLVYAATLRLWQYFAGDAAATLACSIVACLYALNPAHIEAVVWASGRKDVLAGLFSAWAIVLAMDARSSAGISAPRAAAALAALFAAMLSKVTAMMLAPIVALLWLLFWRDMEKKRSAMLAWPAAALVLAGITASLFLSYSTVKLPAYWGAEAYARGAAILGWMLRLSVTPEGRHYAYPVFEDGAFSLMAIIGVAVLLTALAGAAVLLRRKTLAGFALLSFTLLCFPYLQFSPFITHSLVTDRFAFFAAWPVMLLLTAVLWRVKPAVRIGLLLVLMLAFAFQTVARPKDWQSFDRLIEKDAQAYPGYYYPVFHTVEALLAAGEYRRAHDLAGTIRDPEIHNIAVKLTEGAYAAAVDAVQRGDPADALARLQDMGMLLKQPLPAAQWNTPLFSFWLTGRGILSAEWDALARNFPNDSRVREAYRVRQESGF
jgi:hypothetical protein